MTAVVLAPVGYYTAPGKKSGSLPDARALAAAMHESAGVDLALATWDPERRAIESVG